MTANNPRGGLSLRHITHGTPGGYIDGCRCWSCRLGWLSAGRRFRRSVRENGWREVIRNG